MKNIIIFKLVILYSTALTLTSCEKVIDVKMNNATGKIDIEANLTNVQGQQIVYIRQNVPFTNTNTYPPVTGASVTISDQAGNTYPFVEGPSGTYAINNLVGVTGNTYQLMVNAKGSIYTAKSIMPAAINLDTILSKNDPFGGTKRKQLISVVYKDPAGVPNQYRFVMYVNGVQVKRVFAFNDEFTDGKTNTTDLDQDNIDIYPGDSIEVEMQCIDQPIYTYWYTLLQQGDRGPVGSVAPSNPPTNLSNNALGYFSAHTTQTKTIVIK